jgi:iron complex transport system ATP-binding protein
MPSRPLPGHPEPAGLHISNLHVQGRLQPRLDQLCLQLPAAQVALLVGPNGAGKSTLVRCIAGLERPSAGTIRVDGTPLDQLSPIERACKIAWLPQEDHSEGGLLAWELVASARFRFREGARTSESYARRILHDQGAGHLADHPIRRLSGGEAQRVRLASLHAQEAAWWLLDEPANHLDPGLRLELLEQVALRANHGGGILLVSHDLSLLPHLPDARVLGLQNGRLVLDCTAGDPSMPEQLGCLFGLHFAMTNIQEQRRLHLLGRRQ